MKSNYRFILIALSMILLSACATDQNAAGQTPEQAAAQAQPAAGTATMDVKAPETGQVPNYQNQGATNAASMISPAMP
jgi:uncharacterized lipoprotein YajG